MSAKAANDRAARAASGIDDYVRILFYREVTKLEGIPNNYVRREEISARIRSNIDKILGQYKIEGVTDGVNLSEQIFDDLVEAGLIAELKDPFAGSYFRYSADDYGTHRQATLSASDISRISKLVGKPYFPDVFNAYRSQALQGENEIPKGFHAPSADRIASPDADTAAKLQNALNHLIDVLEQDDSEIADAAARLRLVGQLKAGRELVLAGSFRCYLLYATVLRGLGEIAARYDDHIVGIAARKLIELLAATIFKAG
jgi:hypothetical protein